MIALSLALLGPFQASLTGLPLTHFRTRSVQALLVYLAVEPGSHSRESLAELLYPGLPQASSLKNLRQALYELRRIIPDPASASPFFLAGRQSIQLNPEAPFELDASRFTSLNTSSDPASLEAAVKLYRGDFLQNFTLPNCAEFDAWSLSKRAHFKSLALEVLDRLVDHHLQSGDLTHAKQHASRLFDLDDLREPSLRRLMTVLALSGERTAALSAYQSFQERLRLDLDADPSPETAVLFERIRSGELHVTQPATPPPPVPVESLDTPHNLPSQLTPFIGRKSELGNLQQMLSNPAVHLVSLLGQGGSGKTRLALAAAEALLAEKVFPHGIYFIPLADVLESERVPTVIAEALHVGLQQDEDQLLAYLRNKRLLLVLDNFEHLLEARDFLLRLLQAAPQVKILVTSRQRLLLHGEQAFPIHGLPVGDETASEDARLLFLQAAQRLQPDFIFTPENLPDIHRLCKLVEGLPLAIELAAAWIDLLSPADIVREIQRSLDFLQTDLRGQPERHRSMTAVFDTAWNNLSTNSQKFLACLSVFRGGFSREAALAVSGASLRDLKILVDKSLLSFDPQANRYYIHELLRKYCLSRLDLSEVFESYRTFIFDWFIQQAGLLTSGDQEAAASRIEVEIDNLYAAINQSIDSHKLDQLDQVVRGLGRFFIGQNHRQEGSLLFSQLLSQISKISGTPKRTLFWTMGWYMNFLGLLGRETESWQLFPKLQALLADLAQENTNSRAEQAFSNFLEGYLLYFKEPAKSRKLFQHSIELLLELDDRWMAGYALMGKARAARNQEDLAGAEAAATNSLEIFKELNNRSAAGETQRLLGHLVGISGRYAEAERFLLEGIATARKMGQTWALIYDAGLEKLRMVYFFSGRFEDALVPNAEANILSEEYGYPQGLTQNKIAHGLISLHLGRYSEAHKLSEDAFHLAQKFEYDHYMCEALILSAQVDIALGEVDSARKHFAAIEPLCPTRRAGTTRFVAGIDLYLGFLAAVSGQLLAAKDYLGVELKSILRLKNPLNLANAVALSALMEAVKGDGLAAVELYALACQHPFIAHSRWFEDVVGSRIEQAAQGLPPEAVQAAQARGGRLDLWVKAEQMMVDS